MKYPRYPKYKQSGTEWLGEVPAHWALDRMKWSVSACQNGTWGGEPDGIDDIACIRVADFDRQRLVVVFDQLTVRAITEKERKGRLLANGDLLIEKSGGGELQPVGAVVSYLRHEPAVCSNFVARMPIASNQDPRYWTYVHACLYSGRVNVRSIKQTTGIQNLDSAMYLNEVAVYPPYDEQRAIAAFLDRETARIDALIAKKQRLIDLLAEKRTALISHVVTKGLDPDAPMKDAGVEWLGAIPAHWQVKRLKFCLEFLNSCRIPLSAEERGGMERNFPYYGASGIIDSVESFIFDEDTILVAEDGANLLSRSTPLAFVAHGKYWVNNHAHILRPLAGEFVYWEGVLTTYDYTPHITGSAQPKLTKENLGTIYLPCPPATEQRTIVAYIENETTRINRLRAQIESAINQLKEYRAAVVSDAVTGKIDVRSFLETREVA